MLWLNVQGSPAPSARVEFERLLVESQREVLRLQRQLSVTSSRQQHSPDPGGSQTIHRDVEEEVEKVKPAPHVGQTRSGFGRKETKSKSY